MNITKRRTDPNQYEEQPTYNFPPVQEKRSRSDLVVLEKLLQTQKFHAVRSLKMARRRLSFEEKLPDRIYLPLWSRGPKNITLCDYLERFLVFGELQIEILISGFVLAKKLVSSCPLYIEWCPYRTMAGCIYVSHKMLQDTKIWRATEFSEISGLENSEILELEKAIYELLDYRVNPDRVGYRNVAQLIRDKNSNNSVECCEEMVREAASTSC